MANRLQYVYDRYTRPVGSKRVKQVCEKIITILCMKHLIILTNVYHCSYYKVKLTLEAEDENQLEAAYKCLEEKLPEGEYG